MTSKEAPFRRGDIVRHDSWPAGETRVVMKCRAVALPPQLETGRPEYCCHLNRPAHDASRPTPRGAEAELDDEWMARGLRLIGKCPAPDLAGTKGWRFQINYRDGGPPCFYRGDEKEPFERMADAIRAEGGEAFVTAIPKMEVEHDPQE